MHTHTSQKCHFLPVHMCGLTVHSNKMPVLKIVIFTFIFLEMFVAVKHLEYIIPPPDGNKLQGKCYFCDINDKIQNHSY